MVLWHAMSWRSLWRIQFRGNGRDTGSGLLERRHFFRRWLFDNGCDGGLRTSFSQLAGASRCRWVSASAEPFHVAHALAALVVPPAGPAPAATEVARFRNRTTAANQRSNRHSECTHDAAPRLHQDYQTLKEAEGARAARKGLTGFSRRSRRQLW